MNELKPCPFCGGRAEFNRTAHYTVGDTLGWEFGVCCTKCRILLPQRHYRLGARMDASGDITVITDERQKATNEWNRRATDE